ncbi:hypothetical protein Ddye_024152 [Dipteronia dyeriana]|uniref:Reverse transcriptase n=1 Tax=Dipteronia dyeriana TaxID=168575 RepID=A0AAD9WSP2_9ROSI|nr:hypothetical protein Ddye_024152 [Dipteronia dyeriana]
MELRNAYNNVSSGSWKYVQFIESQLDLALETEEHYWRQRSRIDWLKYSDRNTRFFHMKTTVGRAWNQINRLFGDDGLWYNSNIGMELVILSYFGDLFQFCHSSQGDIGIILEGVQPKLSSDLSRYLDSIFTTEEVKKSVFEMGAMKAPGRDGLPALFYLHYWVTVGSSVVKTCLNCLNSGCSMDKVNDTLVVLIPKKKVSERV